MVSTTNLNLAECLKTKTHFGYDTFINICTGAERTVGWTFGDWMAFAVVATMFVGLLVIVIGMTVDFICNGVW